jgi:hypothetical protein
LPLAAPQRTRRELERIYHPRNPAPQQRFSEIDQQSKPDVRYAEVSQQLFQMRKIDRFDGLEFYDQLLADNEISAKSETKVGAFVFYHDRLFSLVRNPSLL